MDEHSTLRFDIDSTSTDSVLGVAIWLDGQCVFEKSHVDQFYSYQHVFPDDEATHVLQIVMSNKTADDTEIDDDGNIVKDAMLTVRAYVDDENIDYILHDHAVYTHDFNGSQPEIQDTFHSLMGCNGTLSIEFTTPLFLWVLSKTKH